MNLQTTYQLVNLIFLAAGLIFAVGIWRGKTDLLNRLSEKNLDNLKILVDTEIKEVRERWHKKMDELQKDLDNCIGKREMDILLRRVDRIEETVSMRKRL